MSTLYPEIARKAVEVLRALPVVIPETGVIAGLALYHQPIDRQSYASDNLHFPMGMSFMTRGVTGVAEYAHEKLRNCAGERSRAMYESIETVYREIAAYFRRHLPVLDEMIACAGGDEKARLETMRTSLDALSRGKPESFLQAVQLYYLMWRLRCPISLSAMGRTDMHLYPFYQADIEKGALTQEAALEILCQLWNRINECGSGDTLVNVMVGGQDAQGQDTTNDLSVLMLKASFIVRKTEPHINVRIHKNTRPDLIEAACRLLQLGHGQPTLYFDEAALKGFDAQGIPREMAVCYANDGCTEIVFDGLSHIDFNHIDAVAAFELALNNGSLTPKNPEKIAYYHRDHMARYYKPEVYEGFESGDTDSLQSFDEFYEIFLRQYRYQVDRKLKRMREVYDEGLVDDSSPIINGSFEPVMERGVDYMGGGLPVINLSTFMGSIPTVADCLMGVKKAVFEDKIVDMPTLKKALAANFEGYEPLRAYLLKAPKFGNDVDEVDLLAADIARRACDWADEFSDQCGVRIFSALVGWRFLQESYGVGATPDGRRYGDPVAEHYCATPGRAKNGPTALINSISKAPLYRASGVAAAHITLPSATVPPGEAGVQLLRSLLTTAMDKGLMMLNIAIYDLESLLNAQKEPEKYTDLIVRVWGFNARFIDLCREMQEHVIRRVMNG